MDITPLKAVAFPMLTRDCIMAMIVVIITAYIGMLVRRLVLIKMRHPGSPRSRSTECQQATIPLELREINPDADFPALARYMFESHEHPPQQFFHIFFPTHRSSDQAREAAINKAATRLKTWHTHNPIQLLAEGRRYRYRQDC